MVLRSPLHVLEFPGCWAMTRRMVALSTGFETWNLLKASVAFVGPMTISSGPGWLEPKNAVLGEARAAGL